MPTRNYDVGHSQTKISVAICQLMSSSLIVSTCLVFIIVLSGISCYCFRIEEMYPSCLAGKPGHGQTAPHQFLSIVGCVVKIPVK